jgi:flagellar basal-body rod modification protein FlgD
MQIPGVRSAEEMAKQTQALGGKEELGKSAFLELMITQIRNQDPLDPTKNEDFVAQLAQFSSLEGIQNMNTSMENMASAFRTSLALNASTMVGRSVMVPTDTVLMDGENGILGAIDLTEDAGKLKVDISNQSGTVVRTIDMGARAAGTIRFGWDGTGPDGNPLPQGLYKIQAYAQSGGSTKSYTVETPDRVVSVSIRPEGATANLASGDSIPVSQIKEVL